MRPLIRGAIIEGPGTSGKTSVLRALKSVQAVAEDDERSVVILGEHYSQQLQTIQGRLTELTRTQHEELLAQRVEAIESLSDWALYLGKASRRARGLFYVFERFNLNHRIAYPGEDRVFIDTLERRLAELGAICFLLTVSQDKIEERFRHRSEQSGQDLQSHDLRVQVESYIARQDEMLGLADEAQVPTTVINTDDRDWNSYAATILKATETRVAEEAKWPD